MGSNAFYNAKYKFPDWKSDVNITTSKLVYVREFNVIFLDCVNCCFIDECQYFWRTCCLCLEGQWALYVVKMDKTIYSEALVPVCQHGATFRRTWNLNISESLLVSFVWKKYVKCIESMKRLVRDHNSYFVLIVFLFGKINIIYKFIFIQNNDGLKQCWIQG